MQLLASRFTILWAFVALILSIYSTPCLAWYGEKYYFGATAKLGMPYAKTMVLRGGALAQIEPPLFSLGYGISGLMGSSVSDYLGIEGKFSFYSCQYTSEAIINDIKAIDQTVGAQSVFISPETPEHTDKMASFIADSGVVLRISNLTAFMPFFAMRIGYGWERFDYGYASSLFFSTELGIDVLLMEGIAFTASYSRFNPLVDPILTFSSPAERDFRSYKLGGFGAKSIDMGFKFSFSL